jgi:hypothetical protein
MSLRSDSSMSFSYSGLCIYTLTPGPLFRLHLHSSRSPSITQLYLSTDMPTTILQMGPSETVIPDPQRCRLSRYHSPIALVQRYHGMPRLLGKIRSGQSQSPRSLASSFHHLQPRLRLGLLSISTYTSEAYLRRLGV